MVKARLGQLAPVPSRERATLLLELGRIQRAFGADEAEDVLLEAAESAAALRDPVLEREVQTELGGWLVSRGDRSVGRAYLERAVEAAAHGSDPRARLDLGLAAAELALARALAGEPEGAETALGNARVAAESAPAARARVELRAADMARARGDSTGAASGYLRARKASVLPEVEPLERATVELLADEGLARVPPSRVTASELAALSPIELASLFDAALSLARTPTSARARRAAELALELTGAAGAQVAQGERVLATTGDLREGALEARHGDLLLRLVPRPGVVLGQRETLMARALLAATEDPQGLASPEAPPSRVLAMLDRVLAAGLELDRLVAVATDLAVEATGAARGMILLREPVARLGYRSARGAGRDLVDPARIASRSLVREAFLSGRPLLLADAASDPRLGNATSVGDRGLRSVLVAPIAGEGGSTLGLLYLDDPGAIGRFGPTELAVAIGFARRLGAPLRAGLAAQDRERAATSLARVGVARPGRPKTRAEFDEIKGSGRATGELLLLLDRAAAASTPVLIRGETGTGKELVAHALHRHGPRASGPFVAVNCSTLADSVLESELFGHVAGAFTGAREAHPGLFVCADSGVLFLDEIQDASPRLQAELLRVIETGEVRPLGGSEVRHVDVRTIAATNADLAALVEAGSFRQDLYYRLGVIEIPVAPLRERLEDVPELVLHLLARANAAGRVVEPEALEKILSDPWAGNVRALRNCLERALLLAGSGPIRAEHVVLEARRRAPPEPDAVYTGAVELNERQLGLLDRLRREGEVGNAEHSEREGVTQTTGWRDLTDLVAKGVLVRAGRGKKTVYRLAPGWESRISGG
jgi:DNA-binding NtrC family response regulator